ncbi:MAG: hypothetical protein WC903_02950 [Candidatus Margulisiibacteriota bacterium]
MREVVGIASFDAGKDRLGPCLTTLFKKQGVELKDIRLDRAAMIRLMGMLPPLETRADNEAIEQIFSGLELSAFLTQDQTLYILGNKGNIKLMAAGSAETVSITTQPPQIELPEMVAVSDKLRIMEGEVTVGLFKQVMQGYEFKEFYNKAYADSFKDALASIEGNVLSVASLFDAREFAKRLSEQTGRKFRVMTTPEWNRACGRCHRIFENRLYSNWTDTEVSRGVYLIAEKYDGGRLDRDPRVASPEARFINCSIILVEDISMDMEKGAERLKEAARFTRPSNKR